MEKDPRNELFQKVLNLVDDVDLEYFSLGMFTKEKASELLKMLDKSESPEDDLFEMMMLEEIEDDIIEEPLSSSKKPFDFSDISKEKYHLDDVPENINNVVKCIAYLHDLIDRFRNGEAVSMTSVTLLKDGKSSIWIPNGFSHDKVDKLFDPVIRELVESDSTILTN